jgi:hypothetical protein
MTGTWKLVLAALGIAGTFGLLAGYASGTSFPAPDVGEPIVLTPTPSPTASARTLSPTPSAPGDDRPHDDRDDHGDVRGNDPGDTGDDDGDDARDDADDARDDDIDHVERTVHPWGEDSDDDDGADDGDDHGDD